jgi:hypothetical protein
MTDRERNELKRLLASMQLADLTIAKQLISHELDQREGRKKFRPVRWDLPRLTR